MSTTVTKTTPAHSTKTARLLAIFTEEETGRFGLWLQSPWANTNKKMVPLHKFMREGLSGKALTKEQLFRKLCPGKPYDDKKMRNLLTALCRQAEQFLAHHRLEKDGALADQLLAKVYLERHEAAWHEKLVEALIEKLEAKKVKETADYLQLALLHDELYYRPESPQQKAGNTRLKMADHYLYNFYSIQKWRYITELNERQMMRSEDNQLTERIAMLEHLTKDFELPVISIYKERIGYAQTLTPDGYAALKAKIFAVFEALSEQDKRLLLKYLINSAARLWLMGFVHILEELMELYKKGMEDGLLANYGRLSNKTYSNVVTTGNSLRQFDYVSGFIETYTDSLAPGAQADGRAWATAHSFYKKHDYERCISMLSAHKFSVQLFAMLSKMLLMQAYFEAYKKDSSYYLFVADFADAFRKYVHREKSLSSDRKTAILNFIKFSFLLLKLMKEKKLTTKSLAALKTLVSNEQHIQGKQWLLEKIAEIEDQYK